MDADEILALERELTDEEFVFLEQDTLKLTRVIRRRVAELVPHIAAFDAGLAERLEISANKMQWALEAGAECPIGDRIAETEALKGLTRDVRRMYVDIMHMKVPTEPRPTGEAVRLPRRDRRRLARRARSRGPWRGPVETEVDTPAG